MFPEKVEQKPFNKAASLIRDIVTPVVLAMLLVSAVSHFWQFANVPTASMEPTIPTKSFLIGDKVAYKNSTPIRGDIVIFKHDGIHLIKRIIALPGETIQIEDGIVLINGDAIVEPYAFENGTSSFGPICMPDNAYFVLGDNRNNSLDARSWSVPYVTFDSIESKAVYMIYPYINAMG